MNCIPGRETPFSLAQLPSLPPLPLRLLPLRLAAAAASAAAAVAGALPQLLPCTARRLQFRKSHASSVDQKAAAFLPTTVIKNRFPRAVLQRFHIRIQVYRIYNLN